MSNETPLTCPELSSTFILPRRIRLDPRASEAGGGFTTQEAPVKLNLSGKEQVQLAARGVSIPSKQDVHIPIPLVPYSGHVEYYDDEGKLSAEIEDDKFHVVPVMVRCQQSECAKWDAAAQRCGAANFSTPGAGETPGE